jgi:palmitoyltransferase ZDHHC9/14/18
MNSQARNPSSSSPITLPLTGPGNALNTRYSPSVISSHMTDIASEDGDEYHPEGAATATQSQARTSVGDSTRPGSSQRETWNRSPTSRRGVNHSARSGDWKTLNAFGGPGVSMSNSSRPQSATSRASRTHVPSLASHTFFRPMSSQRLQAQRGGRPLTSEQAPGTSAGIRSSTIAAKRQSMGSNPRSITEYPGNDMSPPSRGTDFTENDPLDRASANASPTGNGTIQSTGESTRPLQNPTSTVRQPSRDNDSNYKQESSVNLGPLKPTGSFRSSLLLASRKDLPNSARNDPGKDIQPSSDLTAVGSIQGKPVPVSRIPIGRNHQYFSGNTVFFLGGRLQNTRDRPINIATGTLVVLPSVLFLVFSYVHNYLLRPLCDLLTSRVDSGPYLWRQVSPAIPLIFAYIFFICISSFLHASVTDPGVSTCLTPQTTRANALRYYRGISIHYLRKKTRTTHLLLQLQRLNGPWSSHQVGLQPQWTYPQNIVRHATYGVHLERTTAVSATTASKLRTITVSG